MLKEIPIEKIRKSPVALRSVDKESEKYKGLVDSIKLKGILNPIVVREARDAEGFYDLVDGLHRFSAAQDASLEILPCNVISANDAESLIAQVMTNIHKVETRPVEYSRQLVRILGQNPTWTKVQLASQLGKSPAWVDERLGLSNLDSNIAELTDKGEINASNACMLAKLPVEEQKLYLDQAMSMTPLELAPTIQSRLSELRKAAKEGRDPASADMFNPVEIMRKTSEIKEAKNNPNTIETILSENKCKSKDDVANAIFKWILRVDAIGLKEQETKHNTRIAERDAAKKLRAEEREAKKKAQVAAAAMTV